MYLTMGERRIYANDHGTHASGTIQDEDGPIGPNDRVSARDVTDPIAQHPVHPRLDLLGDEVHARQEAWRGGGVSLRFHRRLRLTRRGFGRLSLGRGRCRRANGESVITRLCQDSGE